MILFWIPVELSQMINVNVSVSGCRSEVEYWGEGGEGDGSDLGGVSDDEDVLSWVDSAEVGLSVGVGVEDYW